MEGEVVVGITALGFRGGRAKYFSCKRRVIMNEESAAVDDFRREDAIHDVSNGEAEDV